MNEIEIRKMTLMDFGKIKDILTTEFDEFWNERILKSELESENKIYIVAILNSEPIGFAGLLLNGDETEIMNIVVKKDFRKKGIGTQILNELIFIAEKNNFSKIFLEVNEKNKNARKLYIKSGFTEIGLRKNYYGPNENAIIMSKKLNNL